MSDAAVTVARWAAALPEPATAERVRPDFFYVRLPGEARRWIPIEIAVDARTVRFVSHVIIPPDENHSGVYDFLLRHNFRPSAVTFALAPDGVICLVGSVAVEDVSEDRLDGVAGRIVELTETTFRSILQLGFASRLKRG